MNRRICARQTVVSSYFVNLPCHFKSPVWITQVIKAIREAGIYRADADPGAGHPAHHRRSRSHRHRANGHRHRPAAFTLPMSQPGWQHGHRRRPSRDHAPWCWRPPGNSWCRSKKKMWKRSMPAISAALLRRGYRFWRRRRTSTQINALPRRHTSDHRLSGTIAGPDGPPLRGFFPPGVSRPGRGRPHVGHGFSAVHPAGCTAVADEAADADVFRHALERDRVVDARVPASSEAGADWAAFQSGGNSHATGL